MRAGTPARALRELTGDDVWHSLSRMLRGAARRILASPRAYRLFQYPFVADKVAPVLRHSTMSDVRSVLDLGCGPGTNSQLFHATDYVGVDVEPRYIAYARRRYRGCGEFICADAIEFLSGDERSFDMVLLNSMLHHLDQRSATKLLDALSHRLDPSGFVHIIDLVLPMSTGIARSLALLDRGDFPRPVSAWRELLGQFFTPAVVEPFPVGRFGCPLWQLIYFKGAKRS